MRLCLCAGQTVKPSSAFLLIGLAATVSVCILALCFFTHTHTHTKRIHKNVVKCVTATEHSLRNEDKVEGTPLLPHSDAEVGI